MLKNKEIAIKDLILELYKIKKFDNNTLAVAKRKNCKKYNIKDYPLNSDIIEIYNKMIKNREIKENKDIRNLLKKRKIRTLSGISSVTLLMNPYPCSANCLYCPTEKDMPKSYISNEPAVQRAIKTRYSAYKQTLARLKMYINNGHLIDKIEIILLGGTFSDYPRKYATEFIKSILKALNKFPKKEKETALLKLQKNNSISKNRMVGLTIETRPDKININEIKYLRKLGVTRIEMGAQSLDDDILNKNNRGCNVDDIIKATKLMKDAAFKVSYHMMLNMPFSDIKKDKEQLKKLYENNNFKPDYLKIYPCVVAHNKRLEKLVEEKKFKLYTNKELIDTISEIKEKYIPRYTRIIRIYRDIPKDNIVYGSTMSNIRESFKNIKCQCIRCREIKEEAINKIELNRFNYKASEGEEIFLTFDEIKIDKLIALLRLRIPSQYFTGKNHFIPELQDCALIREVHSYGAQLNIGQFSKGSSQHSGFGKRLIEEAEKITKQEYGLNKIAVIAGIGTREYYVKLGYKLMGERGYMIKKL